jgi:hypothetical protein
MLSRGICYFSPQPKQIISRHLEPFQHVIRAFHTEKVRRHISSFCGAQILSKQQKRIIWTCLRGSARALPHRVTHRSGGQMDFVSSRFHPGGQGRALTSKQALQPSRRACSPSLERARGRYRSRPGPLLKEVAHRLGAPKFRGGNQPALRPAVESNQLNCRRARSSSALSTGIRQRFGGIGR